VRKPTNNRPALGRALALVGAALVACAQAPPSSEPTGSARTDLSWTQQSKLIPSHQLQYSGYYGRSVAFDGTTVAVAGFEPPAVSVFVQAGGVFAQQATIFPAGIHTPIVALDGDDLAIGSNHAIPVYRRTAGTWAQAATLSGLPSSGFGSALAVDAGTLIIGAPLDVSQTPRGAAHVYVRAGNQWTEQAKLIAEPADADGFGTSVAVSGDTALVAVGTGAVHVFVRSAAVWTRQAKLLPAAPIDSSFGDAVALDGDVAVVGAPQADALAGAVYVFARSSGTWSEQARIGAGPSNAGAWFGAAVSIQGALAIVGAPLASLSAVESGAAYELSKEGGVWSQTALLTPSAPKPKDYFGTSVGLSGTTAVIGAPEPFTNTGSAYVLSGKILVEQGAACSSAGDCSTGHCADGVCCNTECAGPCQACSAAKKGGGTDGLCQPVLGGTDPDGDCAPDPGFPASCGADGACDGNGNCRSFAPNGTACGATECSGNEISGSICDGVGACTMATASCSPFACSGSVCTTSCGADADCDASGFCEAGTCRTKKGLGEACVRDAECSEGRCNPAIGQCASGASCSGHVVTRADGSELDCFPYVCEVQGTCKPACSSVSDCVAPALCNQNHECVAASSGAGDDAGCGCRVARERSSGWALAAALLFVWRRRRRGGRG
jgi:MYXO-CTERM domain-containing protein